MPDLLLEFGDMLILVLDDFQFIEHPLILQVMNRMLTSLPRSFCLVLVTREAPPLPLTRLGAHNRITEIRAQDLLFTESEASEFLNEVLGLNLALPDVDALAEPTESWVVGLQFASLSSRNRAVASHYISTVSGSQRHIQSYSCYYQ